MARTQDDDDKVDELTNGLDELKTTVEELQIETATGIDAGQLETVRSALEQASDAADEIEQERDCDDPMRYRVASQAFAKRGS